ncbi:MAG TPA: glutamyl-tRNA reductase [Verrucomicrobiae bacterium]|nr:glutamyl-tRNA reductase [Verrucomicrobiae bacterium]
MNLIVIGLNHRSAPVEVRERLAFAKTALAEAHTRLLGANPVHEVVILSTCNRVEIYALADNIRDASCAVRQFLHDHHGLTERVDSHLYEHRDDSCIRHLLEVACGIDSMVLGETEIFGQVKDAYSLAQDAGTTGVVLNRVFQKVFSAAKHVRSTTAIARGSTSVGTVAVDLAEKIFGKLPKCTVMVIGTGEMSAATARALQSRGAGAILVCSRAQERGEALAVQLQGRAISYDQWPNEFPGVDIVISSTAAPHPIVTREKLGPLMKLRGRRPLFLIDIAVPRDVERSCEELENVYLYDIDDLQQIAEENRAAREREIANCQTLIDQHVRRLAEWLENNRAAVEDRYRQRVTGSPVADPAHPQIS